MQSLTRDCAEYDKRIYECLEIHFQNRLNPSDTRLRRGAMGRRYNDRLGQTVPWRTRQSARIDP